MMKEELLARLGAVEIRGGKPKYSQELREATLEYASTRVAAGDSLNQVAGELGIKGWTLQRWSQNARRAARGGDPVRVSAMSFVRLEPSMSQGVPVEVLLSGRVVRVPVGFDGETLSRVVAILEKGSAA
jgi:transposase-like protein